MGIAKRPLFLFFPDDFDFGAHKLEFNSTEDVLIIENSEETFFITEAGTYSIDVQNGEITINDDIAYTFQLEGDTLTLVFIDDPDVADDEISLFYSKI